MSDTAADSGKLTDAQHEWASKFCGLDTKKATAAPGGAAPAGAAPGGPAPYVGLTPADVAAAKKYMSDHNFTVFTLQFAPAKPADFTPWLDGKATTVDLLARAISATLPPQAAELIRGLVASEYNRLITEAIARGAQRAADVKTAPPAAKGDDDSKTSDATPKKKTDDDGPEVSVEVDPQAKTVETQIQYTVKLRAVNEEAKVQVLPDVEITIHLGADNGKASLEAQLNIIKANVNKLLNLSGKIQIEAKIGISGQVDVSDAALGQIAKSLEVKLKAGLEFKVTKNIYFGVEAEVGPDGKTQIGPKFGVKF